MKIPLLITLFLTSFPLCAGEPARPAEINVGGANFKTDGCCLAWKPEKAAELTGTYVSHSITDGRSKLEIKATGEGEDILLDGKVVTRWADNSESTVSFTHGDLANGGDAHFTAGRGVITGWLVQFVDPDKYEGKKETGPRPAIIFGGDIYVKEE